MKPMLAASMLKDEEQIQTSQALKPKALDRNQTFQSIVICLYLQMVSLHVLKIIPTFYHNKPKDKR